MAKSRRFSISRNKRYETHQLDGQRTIEAVCKEFQIRIGKKLNHRETFEYLATEYGSLKSITLIFMIG